ncbi:hypothetical protein [Acetobacter persici]|uniref:hypothetical protein n=1 Tax=Acetobacter persici TaxID=1076596 RepID=UPI001BACC860|nr:hypothetical protein [Acetobacter persici]MBS1017316.1 hypothetical protein [Acetobacter persici]
MITENIIFRKFLNKILLVINNALQATKNEFPPLETYLENLEYQQKIQPNNGLITTGIGVTRLLLGIPSASEPFELINSRSGSRLCRILLVATRLRFSHYTLALEEFQSLLANYTEIDLPAFHALAQAMCFVTNRAGWCTFSGSGKLHFVFRRPVLLQDIHLVIDGTLYPADSFETLFDAQKLTLQLPKNWTLFKNIEVKIQKETILERFRFNLVHIQRL